ncbi:MAG: DUF3180 domain-containing protein [Mycobacteriales bacterium]
MRPTRARELLFAAVLAGVLATLAFRSVYPALPVLPLSAPVSLGLVALAEGYTAVITRARLRGRPGTRAIAALVVARLAALAKASSLAGALVAGAWAGLLAVLAPRLTTVVASRHDAIVAAAGLVVALLLVGAALALEQACRVPGGGDQPPDGGAGKPRRAG